MFKNPLLEEWSAGRATLNGWLASPCMSTAEVMAHAGWDSLTIDMQHGLADYQTAVEMLTAIATTDVVPLARVPWMDEGIVMRMLDAGCLGVICPMVNSQDEAARLATACRYPPNGRRSYGPIRAALLSGSDYWRHANREVLSIAMIETREALDALDSILDVEELSGVYIGPADLSLALGCEPTFDQEAPIVEDAIEHIITTTKARGKYVGVHNLTPAYARRRAEIGADFVSVSSDLRLMSAAAKAAVAEFHGHGPKHSPPPDDSAASY